MRTRHSLIYVALFGLLAANTAYASCGSTACSINTNWDEHSTGKPGWTVDLRYSYSKADQLRSGSSKITFGYLHISKVVETSPVVRIGFGEAGIDGLLFGRIIGEGSSVK